jgi:hypothetical protein
MRNAPDDHQPPICFTYHQKRSEGDHRGFCVGCDRHIERPKLENNSSLTWKVNPSDRYKFVHYFTFYGNQEEPFDPTYAVGRYGWYEQLYKPIEVLPATIDSEVSK